MSRIGSLPTGQISTHAPQDVQAQTASSEINSVIATFEEAMALRERNKEVNILIFGPIEKSSMKIASENDLRFPIVSFDEIDYLNSNNINCNIHVKIDTGMGRVGFQYQDAEKAIELIKNSSTINIEGIFSHLFVLYIYYHN